MGFLFGMAFGGALVLWLWVTEKEKPRQDEGARSSSGKQTKLEEELSGGHCAKHGRYWWYCKLCTAIVSAPELPKGQVAPGRQSRPEEGARSLSRKTKLEEVLNEINRTQAKYEEAISSAPKSAPSSTFQGLLSKIEEILSREPLPEAEARRLLLDAYFYLEGKSILLPDELGVELVRRMATTHKEMLKFTHDSNMRRTRLEQLKNYWKFNESAPEFDYTTGVGLTSSAPKLPEGLIAQGLQSPQEAKGSEAIDESLETLYRLHIRGACSCLEGRRCLWLVRITAPPVWNSPTTQTATPPASPEKRTSSPQTDFPKGKQVLAEGVKLNFPKLRKLAGQIREATAHERQTENATSEGSSGKGTSAPVWCRENLRWETPSGHSKHTDDRLGL